MKKIPFYRIFLLIITVSLLFYLLQFQENKNIAKTTTLPVISKNIENPKPCVRNPDIQFFMYHYIRSHDPHDNASTQDLSVDPEDFRTEMSYVRDRANEWKITLMNGVDLIASLQSRCFPGNHIWVFTSDDGWSDTYTNLVPIAKEYWVPFFLGIIGNRIDTTGFVTSQQVREISNNPLFTISSHSMTHDEQDKMSEKSEKYEICESKKILENLIKKPILTYIYPVWKMSQNSQKIAKSCEYSLAWSTGFGSRWNPTNPSRYDINRIRIHHTTTINLFHHVLEEAK